MLPAAVTSPFSPSGRRQLKRCMRLAKIKCNSGLATISPRQTLLPAENGSQLSGLGPSFPSLSKYLSGINWSWFSHFLGSL